MDKELERRIRSVYPQGVLWERDDAMLGAENQGFRVDQAMNEIVGSIPVSVGGQQWNNPSSQFHITSRDDPPFAEWVYSMRNPDKLDWIRRNQRLYVVLWLQVSRVADYYYVYFNHWTPRGDTGYLDADFRREPDQMWAGYKEVVMLSLQARGFAYASDEMLRERIPFLLQDGYDEIPESDPRWDDDNFEPPHVQSNVHECLFGD